MNNFPFPLYGKMGSVICQLCGVELTYINARHLKFKHNISILEYKEKFPEAPLTGEKFSVTQKYKSNKKLFVEEKSTVVAEIPNYDVIEDKQAIEELEIENLTETTQSIDICDRSKDQLLKFLRNFYIDIRKDFLIQIRSPNGDIQQEIITDFADPELQIDIEFPDTFWHNVQIDPTRKTKLELAGWKVIEVRGKNPNLKDIETELNKVRIL